MTLPDPEYLNYNEFVLIMFISGVVITVFTIACLPEMYFLFSTFVLVFYLFKIVSMTSGVIINYFRFRRISNEIGAFDAEGANSLSTHVFVIPSYKESIEVLRETVGLLVQHPYCHTYCVFMAMEKREKGSAEKAESLQK